MFVELRYHMRLYAGSDEEFYTEYEVGYQIETGTWQPCMWDPDEGWELVETPDDQLLWLLPIDESDLPSNLEVQSSDVGKSIVDTRDS